MAAELRLTLEEGPKGKKVVAVAPDWPGLSRGAKTGEAAIERLRDYLPRYAPVATLAGMEADFAPFDTIEVVEQYPGTGSTDFWGISFAYSSIDRQEMSPRELGARTGADAGLLGVFRRCALSRVGADAEGTSRGWARPGRDRAAHGPLRAGLGKEAGASRP